MGEDEGRAVLHQAEERLLDDRLVFGIDRRERLVEDEDGRIAQDGAGDGDPLALAAGEPDAAFPDHGLVARRQDGDEVVGVGEAAGFLHLVFGRVGLAELEVVLDGAVKEVGVLVDDRDLPAEIVCRHGPDVAAADRDGALLRVPEPQQQAHDRGLAGA